MPHRTRRSVALTLALLGAAGAYLLACSSEPKTPAASNHDAAPAHWSYEGDTGPAHWGTLATDYALCDTGTRQSPIDLAPAVPADLPNITFRYHPGPVTIRNNGHTIQVTSAPGSYIVLEGERYDLVQFHFHAPSEHRIGDRAAEAEMHLVHKSSAGALAVVGVLIDEGPRNPAFEPVWTNLPATPGSAERRARIDAATLLPADPRTFRYDGSLTTPPGTEGVRWCVMTEPVNMSAAQLGAFRAIHNGNNRPIQPRNDRAVVQDSSR